MTPTKVALLVVLTMTVMAQAAGAASRRHAHQQRNRMTNPVILAVGLAERYWHATPCAGKIAVMSGVEPPANSFAAGPSTGGLRSGALIAGMWATWVTTATGEYTACTVTVNRAEWATWSLDDSAFRWFCDEMTHEIGHFLGHEDEGQTNRASIEYPLVEPGSPNYNSVPECRNVVLHYGGITWIS